MADPVQSLVNTKTVFAVSLKALALFAFLSRFFSNISPAELRSQRKQMTGICKFWTQLYLYERMKK